MIICIQAEIQTRRSQTELVPLEPTQLVKKEKEKNNVKSSVEFIILLA
jgi:hypothetical protein